MKTIKLIIVTILFSLIYMPAFSQVFTIYKDKAIGTSTNESVINSILLSTNSILLAGTSDVNINTDKTDPLCDSTIIGAIADIWLLKMDTSFNIYWDKSIGGEKTESDPHIFINKNNQIALVCRSTSDSSCEKSQNDWSATVKGDYWEIILDTLGNKIWDKTWGGTGMENDPQMLQFTNGDYLICGQSKSPISGDKTEANCNNTSNGDLWVIKTDSIGIKIWDKVYGGNLNENTSGWSGVLPRPNLSILRGGNNSALFAVSSNSPISCDVSDSSRGGVDIWLTKIDSSGNKLWDKRFGNTGQNQYPEIVDVYGGGYIMISQSSDGANGDVTDSINGVADIWIVKLDSLGNILWDKRYGGETSCIAAEIKPALDGGYLICGNINGNAANDVSENSYGITDYWIFKIDENGNKIWDKRFGGPGSDFCNGMLLMQDTSIILYGIAYTGISPVKTDSGIGRYDNWFIHFKYTDTTSTVGFIDPIAFDASISLYPNPASDVVTIASNKTQIQNVTMYNLLGELIETKNYTSSHNIQFDLQTYPKGVYIAKITGQKNISTTRKIIKL
jgi:hypothetical protein